jgi:hypothetical protein
MEWGQVGLLGWQFGLAILPASAWLIICRLIPVLRLRVGFSYCIAVAIVLASCLITFTRYGSASIGLLAAGASGVILFVRWRRALKQRSLDVNTIISYHD